MVEYTWNIRNRTLLGVKLRSIFKTRQAHRHTHGFTLSQTTNFDIEILDQASKSTCFYVRVNICSKSSLRGNLITFPKCFDEYVNNIHNMINTMGKGRVQWFSMQVVMNKCFLLNPENNFRADLLFSRKTPSNSEKMMSSSRRLG